MEAIISKARNYGRQKICTIPKKCSIEAGQYVKLVAVEFSEIKMEAHKTL